jgi:hemerythrin superfamily protein
METPLTAFYEEDHRRLDGLFAAYQALRRQEPAQAKEILRRFRSGLEQHMAWEEAILFSEYDARAPEAGLTAELLGEHAEIMNLIDRIEEKGRRQDPDTDREEARLLTLLSAHNEREERGIYLTMDALVDPRERSEIFAKMKDATWDEESPRPPAERP